MKGSLMKRLTYLVVILAVIYSGYWIIGSSALKNAVQSQQVVLTEQGWDVGYVTLKTRGYPSRFDTTVTDLNITTPDRSTNFAASMIQILALSYQPNKAIIAFPPEQTLTMDGLPVVIQSDGLRASVSANANTSLSLNQISAEAASVIFSLGNGQLTSYSDMLAAVRESSSSSNTYGTYLTATDIAWPALILGQLPADSGLPDMIGNITLDASVTLDRPLDRHTLPDWATDPGQLRGLNLRGLSLTWGPFNITADGSFTVDHSGTPDGTITLTMNDWKGVLAAAQSTGFLPAQFQFMAQSMGQTLSQGDETLVLPITVQNGNLSVGPFPLGPSPKF